jgi:hypothetical protein
VIRLGVRDVECFREGWIGGSEANTLVLLMKPYRHSRNWLQRVRDCFSRLRHALDQFVRIEKLWVEWRRDCLVVCWVERDLIRDRDF